MCYCVIISRDEYISKMMNILSDKSKFKEVNEDNTESRFVNLKIGYLDIKIYLVRNMIFVPPRLKHP